MKTSWIDREISEIVDEEEKNAWNKWRIGTV